MVRIYIHLLIIVNTQNIYDLAYSFILPCISINNVNLVVKDATIQSDEEVKRLKWDVLYLCTRNYL